MQTAGGSLSTWSRLLESSPATVHRSGPSGPAQPCPPSSDLLSPPSAHADLTPRLTQTVLCTAEHCSPNVHVPKGWPQGHAIAWGAVCIPVPLSQTRGLSAFVE